MSQVTRCPSCGTRFKVVADQLRISQGWVRCGMCQSVFDASQELQSVPDELLQPEAADAPQRPAVQEVQPTEAGEQRTPVWPQQDAADAPAPDTQKAEALQELASDSVDAAPAAAQVAEVARQQSLPMWFPNRSRPGPCPGWRMHSPRLSIRRAL